MEAAHTTRGRVRVRLSYLPYRDWLVVQVNERGQAFILPWGDNVRLYLDRDDPGRLLSFEILDFSGVFPGLNHAELSDLLGSEIVEALREFHEGAARKGVARETLADMPSPQVEESLRRAWTQVNKLVPREPDSVATQRRRQLNAFHGWLLASPPGVSVVGRAVLFVRGLGEGLWAERVLAPVGVRFGEREELEEVANRYVWEEDGTALTILPQSGGLRVLGATLPGRAGGRVVMVASVAELVAGVLAPAVPYEDPEVHRLVVEATVGEDGEFEFLLGALQGPVDPAGHLLEDVRLEIG